MLDRWTFLRKLLPVSLNKRSVIAWTGAFIVCITAVLLSMHSGRFAGTFTEFQVGMVADRDVVAEQTIIYIDEQATRLRIEAAEKLVPAVFHFSQRATDEQLSRWQRFAALADNYPLEDPTGETAAERQPRLEYRLAIQMEFPGMFPDDVLDLLYDCPEQAVILRSAEIVLEMMLERGIYAIPSTGLENLNPDVLELIRQSETRIEQERVAFRDITTRDGVLEALEPFLTGGSQPSLFPALAPHLLQPFLRENVFYSPDDTARRIAEARARTEPVMRTIEQGTRVIKRGFIITEEDMREFNALMMSLRENDFPRVFSNLLFLAMLFSLLLFVSESRLVNRKLRNREIYLIAGLSALYIGGSVLVQNMDFGFMPVSVAVPTALVIMIPSILIHPRLALILAMAFPLGAFLTGSFDAPAYIFALVSGVVAAYSLQGAEKRMDLVKAGLVIAAANIAAMTAVLLWQHSPAAHFPFSLFWAAINGIASGMLVLGVLSPLEHALNAATTFRLIELSDLNAPILKRLFTTAPGTYSHSIMVANLAEAACQDIGANYLLARVGAYFHDLGKMDNPGYFAENQADYNPHDDMAPRLSATVIRSHVKLGLEKARQLGLPGEVMDVISEHHGNSVITWFYSKALKQEDQTKGAINKDDFCYPGNPPHSKESAVVMLADVTEAAARTIDKPTALKLEKFIQELIASKVEHGQLAKSELSFRDLEIIKNAFVRVLAAYYHTRIEYPKIDGETESSSEGNGTAAARRHTSTENTAVSEFNEVIGK